MADFMDEEAQVSSGEEEEMSGDEDIQAQKKKKRALDSSDEEDEEEDEEKAREEMKDFIADEEEEVDDRRARKRKKKKRRKRSASGSGSGGSGSRSRSGSASGSGSGGSKSRSRSRSRSRRRSRSASEDDLDDEDMDLIQENLGTKFQKKRSRIQKMDSDESEDESRRSRSRSGSGDDELPDPERRRSRSGSGDDEDDVNDFIVDEEGKPIEKKKSKKRHIFEDSQRQLAEDIFGVAFDYEEFEQYEGSGGDETEEEEDYDEDDPPAERKRREKKRGKKGTTIFDIFDPYELAKGHYTDTDQEIRTTDIPERMQLRTVPVTTVPDDSDELDREAEWIYKHGFVKPSISKQVGYTIEDCATWELKSSTTEKIKKALDFMRQQFLEVPFIAFYRKEYVAPELSDINHLWRVYHMDEKWCQLQNRKRNIKRLFEKMQTYQNDFLLADPTTGSLTEGTSPITQEDFDRLESVESVEELKDVYQHFLLYHGRNIGDCQEFHRKRLKEERAERRERKKLGRIKKYKTVKRTIKRKATKTVTKTVTETVENEETGEPEEVEKEVEEEVETEVESEVDEEITDDEAMLEDQDEDDDDEEEPDEDDHIKHATRSDHYSLCVKFKLTGLAKSFGLTAEEFGENLQDNYLKNQLPDNSGDFEDVAREYMSEKLNTKEIIAKAAVVMVATQLSREPSIRGTVREAFHERSVVTIKPTKRGMKEIGEDHELYAMKYLNAKPVRAFSGDEFLKILAGVENKLIDMKIGEDLAGSQQGSTYVGEAIELYKEDGFSTKIEYWNDLRKQAVEMCLKTLLFPQLRKELIHKMRTEAIEGIKRACQRTLGDWIKGRPFTVDWKEDDFDEDDWDSSGGCRILGISYSSDKDESSFAALITAEGEVGDYLRLPFLLCRASSFNVKESTGKVQDMKMLKRFIENKRPHGIAICSEDRNAIIVRDDVCRILEDLTAEDEAFPKLQVIMTDSNLAVVYSNTNKSNNDFREHPTVLKQAISAGRRLQDPLVEFSQLCNPENDILCVRYHPLQDMVGEEHLLSALNQEFINIVNKVGVDINECVAHPHTSNLVQFIGGLGPRKGASLLKTLRGMSNPRLENRQQLVTSCHMGPKVFINCAGFVKIDTSALGDSEQYIEVLDGSRIHNEAYEWARKMAVDALEYDDDEEEGNPASAVEDILRQPEKLEELNLDAFAEELERQGFGNKGITLYDIREELNNMYGEKREKWKPPTPEDIFDMTNKETPETFYVGKLMQARVSGFAYKKTQREDLDTAAPVRKDTDYWECPFCGRDDFPELTEVWNHFDAVEDCPGKCIGVKIVLENGIPAFIDIRELSDSQVLKPEERVRQGMNIYVRILKINPDNCRVAATCKTSALKDAGHDYRPTKDNYYDSIQEQIDTEAEVKDVKKKAGTSYMKRVIIHPQFHNIGYKEAEKLLAGEEQGDVIIRPSSKGQDHLSVSWKVTDDIYQHIDVEERGKANAFSLGTSLIILNEEYEDLDEIIARFINPMASHTRDILNYKYFKQGKKAEVESQLIKEKGMNNSKIPYLFSPCTGAHAGKFLLSYLPRNAPRHEFVSVTPEGYRFRRQMHDTMSGLVKWFKEHFRDPIPGTPATASPGGQRNSFRTPYGGTGRSTPGQRPGITPGAMSMASGTPYGTTPGRRDAAYTPTANTPYMTPVGASPGPSRTPRGMGGSTTPRGYGAGTPRGGSTPGSGRPGASPAQSRASKSGNIWAEAAKQYAAANNPRQQQQRTPRGGEGYSTTPRYDDPRRTPGYGGRTPSRTPAGQSGGGRTPSQPGRTPTQPQRTPKSAPYGSREQGRTPRGQFGDATPLYDE